MTVTVIVALAATRLIRAWNHETIFEVPSRAVQTWAATPVTDNGVVDLPATIRREKIGELFGCPHCLGVWVSIGMTVAWAFPPVRPVIRGLAAAALLSAAVDHYSGFDPETETTG